MNPEYYDNKKIIKYLKKNFGDIDSRSDTNIENFKRNIKSKYNKKQLQEIHRKIMLHKFDIGKSPLSNMLSAFYGAVLAAVITFLFTYSSLGFNQLNFYADNLFSIKLSEEDSNGINKEELLEEINGLMTDATRNLMSLTIKLLLVFFVIIIIMSIV